MKSQRILPSCATAILLALTVFFPSENQLRADLVVAAGWDLYTTGPVVLNGQTFTSSPLGSYNFGGSVGVQPVGNADMIIRRTSDSSGNPAAIAIQLVALQLVTPILVNFESAGLDFYYLTLNGVQDPGQMSVSFANDLGGTFTINSLPMSYDVRKGSPTGTVVLSDSVTLTMGSQGWGRTAPANAVAIAGVNLNLNGANNARDFWSAGNNVASAPEPGAWLLASFAIPGLAFAVRRSVRRLRQAR